jgi:hypothetical protein
MPGITLHFVLASRVLQRWSAAPGTAPFDLDDPVARNAFYHGAVGPDIGYLPGGHRILSELAHQVSTGKLTGRLIQSARTPSERAFAWGWLTHVLADREIHPLIGRGVGELVHGCRDTFVPGARSGQPLARGARCGLRICGAARRRDDAATPPRLRRTRPCFRPFGGRFVRRGA